MTVEQRIHRLDKRVALFENYLQMQSIGLNIKYKKCSPVEKLMQFASLSECIMQFPIIASQTMPKFKSGGYVR